MTDTVLVGAGGFGREALDVVEAINRENRIGSINILGVIDDDPAEENLRRLKARGYRYYGTVSNFMQDSFCESFILAIGNPRVREMLSKRLDHAGLRPLTVIHPEAVVGSMNSMGEGSIVCSGAQISTNVRTGAYVHLNPNSTIGHDSILEDYVSINPGAIVSGEVVVKARSMIGAGAVVLQGLTIGSDTVVGASACVTRTIGSQRTVTGIPARETLHSEDAQSLSCRTENNQGD